MKTLNIKKENQKSSWAQNRKLSLQSGTTVSKAGAAVLRPWNFRSTGSDQLNLPVWQFLRSLPIIHPSMIPAISWLREDLFGCTFRISVNNLPLYDSNYLLTCRRLVWLQLLGQYWACWWTKTWTTNVLTRTRS